MHFTRQSSITMTTRLTSHRLKLTITCPQMIGLTAYLLLPEKINPFFFNPEENIKSFIVAEHIFLEE